MSLYLRKVNSHSPNTLYNMSGFSPPPIKTDRHHRTEKLLSVVKQVKKSDSKL
jgi:hypothetical protein